MRYAGKAFVINLDRSPDRWQFMCDQASVAGVDLERISGTDGAVIPDWLRDEFSGPHELTPGEIGCYVSHLKIAQMVVGQGMPHAIVLEDDVTLSEGFGEACQDALRQAPSGWDYIHLSSVVKRAVLAVAALKNRSLIRYSRLPVNTAAYILSNRGARKWLTPMARKRPNDMDIRYAFLANLNVLGVYPPIASQENDFPSVIGGTHAPNVYDPRSFSPGPFSELRLELWTAARLGLINYLRARSANVVNSGRKLLDGRRRVAVLSQIGHKHIKSGASVEQIAGAALRKA